RAGPPEIADEGPLRPVAPHLRHAHSHMEARASLQPAKCQRRRQIPQVQVAPPVALPGEGEDRVRTGPHLAVDAWREVDPEEREARVRRWTDQPADGVS